MDRFSQLRLLSLSALLAGAICQAPGYQWGGGACTTEDDCSLGGECVASVCVCDNYFTGPQCDLLNLQRPRLDEQAGTCHRGFNTYYSWGGKALRGDDGKAHLIASFMCRHKDLAAWTTDSSSAHFVADELDGAYSWADVDCDASGVCTPIIAPWSHNTVCAENGPGRSPRYLVAHIGNGVVDPAQWAPCFNKSDVPVAPTAAAASAAAAAAKVLAAAEASSSRLRNGPDGTCYFSVSDNVNGPWRTTLNNEGVQINNSGSWGSWGIQHRSCSPTAGNHKNRHIN